MRVVFVRHAQSTGNAGAVSQDHEIMALTDVGQAQAAAVAAAWTSRPDFIVTSHFLRTQQTAQPTKDRFEGVATMVLPMEEFTYLEPSRWNGTARSERVPQIEAFWRIADPAYRDGPGAESFDILLGRIDQTLKILQSLPPSSLIYAFSHGQFMQALRVVLTYPLWTAKQKMENFWAFNARYPIHNAQTMEVVLAGQVWQTPAA